jgi:polysaccharide pyruvyl transferase CsaB
MHALLMGYYGGRNLGDEMMLFCLRRWLEAQHVNLTILTEGARDVERRHGLAAVENVPLLGQWAWRDAWLRGKALKVLGAIARHDALIVGGGDLIRDDRGWGPFFFAVEKLVVAMILGRPVYLVNIGIGTPKTRYGRILLRWVLPRCARIIARDERTFALCQQLGAAAVTEYASDIVFSLPSLLQHGNWTPGEGRRYVLVCLRTHANDFSQFAWTPGRVQTFAAGLDRLIEQHDLDIVFFPFQALDSEQDDNAVHRTVADAMAHRSRVTVREWSDDLREVGRAVSEAECVVAMRLHAAVLACALGRRCVLMPYDYKVAEFGRQMELRHEITPDTLESPSALGRVLEAALTDSPGRRARVAPASWETLTLAAPLGEPLPAGCS